MRTALVLLAAGTTVLALAAVTGGVVPPELVTLAVLAWFTGLGLLIRKALRRGGRQRAVLEAGLGLSIVLVLVGATAVLRSLRQDDAAGRAAVTQFEARTQHTQVGVYLLRRFGDCAVVTLRWPDGSAFVALQRRQDSWRLIGEVQGLVDTDDVANADTCRFASERTRPPS